METFVDLLKSGRAHLSDACDDINNFIAVWHLTPRHDPRDLHVALGLTLDEYVNWVKTGAWPEDKL